MRIIIHADMDAFYAAVEQLDDPSLKAKPVIVGGTSDRGVVSTASYEARRFGVGSAMPMVEARRRCPHAMFLRPRMERYVEVSAVIMEVFESFSPLVEPLSLDEAFIDMTGAQRLFGGPVDMGAQIKKKVLEATGGLTVSVGVSTTKYVAKVASDHQKPDGLTHVPEEMVLAFLHPLPISRLWGAGKRTQESLENLGLHTIGDVAQAPEELLRRRFGPQGEHFKLLAMGTDAREVIPDREAKSIGAENTLSEDVSGFEEIRPHIRQAVEKVARRLRKHSLRAGGVRVKLKTAAFRLISRQATLVPASDTFATIESACIKLLDEFDLDQPYRLVGMAAFNLESTGAGSQGELFTDPEEKKHRNLEKSMDRLRDRFGDAIKRGPDEQ